MIWFILSVLVWVLILCLLLRANKSKEDIVIMDAEQARQVRRLSADRKDLDKLLKPVLKKIDKAANKGLSKVGLFERDWFIQDKLVYQKALQELRNLGYTVRFQYNYQGVIVSWHGEGYE